MCLCDSAVNMSMPAAVPGQAFATCGAEVLVNTPCTVARYPTHYAVPEHDPVLYFPMARMRGACPIQVCCGSDTTWQC